MDKAYPKYEYPGNGSEPTIPCPQPDLKVEETLLVRINIEADGRISANKTTLNFGAHYGHEKSAGEKKSDKTDEINPRISNLEISTDKLISLLYATDEKDTKSQTDTKPPLHLSINKPTLIIFQLVPKTWEFHLHPFVIRNKKFGENYPNNDTFYELQAYPDADGRVGTISVLNICNWRSEFEAPRRYMFELMIDVKHHENGQDYSTTIVIDPPNDNDGRG